MNPLKKSPLEAAETCKRCGQPFHCSKSPRCWCYEVDVPIEKLEELQREYDGCLCPECLKEFASSP